MTNKPGDNIESKSQNTDTQGADDDHIEDREGMSKSGKKAGRHGQSQESISTIVKSFPKGTHVTAAEVYERAIEMGYELSLSTVYRNLHRFLPALLRMEGAAKMVEMPVAHRPRRHGTSKYGIGNRLWVGIVDLFGVRWLQARHFLLRVRDEG